MKSTLIYSLVGAAMLAFTSCNEKAKLAQSVTGAWSGQAERVEVPNAKTTTTVTRMFTFTPATDSKTGGDFTATALFSVESGTELQATGTQPIAVTVNGTATINGKWEAVDEDELMVSFDSNSLAIDINPDEVVLEYNIATETSTPVDEAVRPDIVKDVTTTMTSLLQKRVFNYSKIEDIKIKGVLMSCKIDKQDYTLRRDQ